MSWVLPYPGDWHTLKNYQPALMKAYFDAGLKDMAKAAGYPVAPIQSCSQFKRVHRFILEVWEALYRAMLAKYMEVTNSDMQVVNTSFNEVQELVLKSLESIPSLPGSNFREMFNYKLSEINKLAGTNAIQFYKFLQNMADQDDTWKFWKQFLIQNAMTYVGLFLALQSGDWHLRYGKYKVNGTSFYCF